MFQSQLISPARSQYKHHSRRVTCCKYGSCFCFCHLIFTWTQLLLLLSPLLLTLARANVWESEVQVFHGSVAVSSSEDVPENLICIASSGFKTLWMLLMKNHKKGSYLNVLLLLLYFNRVRTQIVMLFWQLCSNGVSLKLELWSWFKKQRHIEINPLLENREVSRVC